MYFPGCEVYEEVFPDINPTPIEEDEDVDDYKAGWEYEFFAEFDK